MTDKVTISIDAMGGDNSPGMVVDGMRLVLKKYPDIRFILYGDEKRLKKILDKNEAVRLASSVVHTDDVISNDIKPSQAIRSGSRETSMWKAIQAVKDGEAGGIVSAGNTGALMAMSKLCLRSLPGVHRPAIVGLLPTVRGSCVMLDIGANTDCSTTNLVEFAVMGKIFAQKVLGIKEPKIGLLNIGSEDMKGKEEIREASQAIKDKAEILDLNFHGFVEGHDIGAHTVDVVVTDGFTGNVALKTLEGTAKLINRFLKDAVKSSYLLKMAFLFSKKAVSEMKEKMDPRKYNGAMFIGLNGIAVKSHGGADAVGFSTAIETAIKLVDFKLNEKISKELENLTKEQNKEQD